MAFNTTNYSENGQDWLLIYIPVMTLASFIALGNTLIVLSIARYEALRKSKEHVLMMGLSMADTLNMTAFVMAAIHRLKLLWLDVHHTTSTVSACLGLPQTLLMSYGILTSSMMLLALSVDRLVCVLWPLSYVGWTATYARRLVASVYILKLLDTIYFYVAAYGSEQPVPATCALLSLLSTLSPIYRVSFRLASVCFPFSSVLVYFVVIWLHSKRNRRVHPSEHPNQEYELRRQHKVTVTLWVGALCTLFLFVIPFGIGILLHSKGYIKMSLAIMCFTNVNSMASVCIYPLRHQEIRVALRCMFTARHMPADIKLWKVDRQLQFKLVNREHSRAAAGGNNGDIDIASM